jgi:hypothetical protein
MALSLLLVLTIYRKSGGSHGAHGWVEQIGSIAEASYIAVQSWTQYGRIGPAGPVFHAVDHKNVHLQVNRFDLLHSYQFLILVSKPKPTNVNLRAEGQPDYTLTPGDSELWSQLSASQSVEYLRQTMKMMAARSQV